LEKVYKTRNEVKRNFEQVNNPSVTQRLKKRGVEEKRGLLAMRGFSNLWTEKKDVTWGGHQDLFWKSGKKKTRVVTKTKKKEKKK